MENEDRCDFWKSKVDELHKHSAFAKSTQYRVRTLIVIGNVQMALYLENHQIFVDRFLTSSMPFRNDSQQQ